MKLADQVCNLELAQKLKELRVSQESLFWWGVEAGLENTYHPRVCTDLSRWDDENMIPVCAAFTVAELGEMMPENYYSFHWSHLATLGTRVWTVSVQEFDENDELKKKLLPPTIGGCSASTEADARAKILIYLLENNLLYHNPPKK